LHLLSHLPFDVMLLLDLHRRMLQDDILIAFQQLQQDALCLRVGGTNITKTI